MAFFRGIFDTLKQIYTNLERSFVIALIIASIIKFLIIDKIWSDQGVILDLLILMVVTYHIEFVLVKLFKVSNKKGNDSST
ncbi:hypothetical protein LRP52_39930 [Photobacterium sp. ZSDE20]|uniref:DUF2061 domain-containing protein n=1 Tax=Photobacterium pectinilyticum TaxID=2906793 RepID=A0ABT1N7L3_9GAMM|nr:hypothetical protein [Photobacterium sp. ZSDE20]MCQ1060721.1 hypothetical protein [Photobacterium sp. ZSDE20]MDD1828352.1 hypothetical protein [Photobacterium sp. ZSDE20]